MYNLRHMFTNVAISKILRRSYCILLTYFSQSAVKKYIHLLGKMLEDRELPRVPAAKINLININKFCIILPSTNGSLPGISP